MPLSKIIKQILRASVVWREVVPGGVEFHAEVKGHTCKLRMNDFPEEPLYTLIVEGEELDIDDAPKGWSFPSLPEE